MADNATDKLTYVQCHVGATYRYYLVEGEVGVHEFWNQLEGGVAKKTFPGEAEKFGYTCGWGMTGWNDESYCPNSGGTVKGCKAWYYWKKATEGLKK